MANVGLVGWRGMVGSVLMERMKSEKDFDSFKAHYFSTSQVGESGPDGRPLLDAKDLNQLSGMDVIVSCQGGDYTKALHPKLRDSNWNGYWIDAASALRMNDDAVVVLDPVNRQVMDEALESGCRDFVGGNCTVSLLLLALAGLLQEDKIEWISTMTYQAASGGGARHMKELLTQMGELGELAKDTELSKDIIKLDAAVTAKARNDLNTDNFGVPLAASAIPWIDSVVSEGVSREEWKAEAEGNKILGKTADTVIPIDGLCVRVGALRCHSQALTIKLKEAMSVKAIEECLGAAHQWVDVIPNDPDASKQNLTPIAVSGKLNVAIGRIRQMSMGPEYISAFTVGDQLLWGAAEPLRRALNIILKAKF